MIAIVSSSAHERAAFTNLCEDRGWNTVACSSVRTAKRQLAHESPSLMLLRQQLEDGYADDVISALSGPSSSPRPKIIVLLSAFASAACEVRLIEMGADCIQRDPIRSEVVLAYLTQYIRLSRTPRQVGEPSAVHFAGARLNPLERTLHLDESVVSLTPREVLLVEVLAGSKGQIVTYETLYSEVLGRRFRGDTSNMRVLLGKLGSSIRPLGLTLQHHVDVIPKTGYRYHWSNGAPVRRTTVTDR